jgi:hypothetical protein
MIRRNPSLAIDWRALAHDQLQRQLPIEPITASLKIIHAIDTMAAAIGIGEGAECYALDIRAWTLQLIDEAETLVLE